MHLSETKKEHDACVEKYGLTPAQVLDCHHVFDVPVVAAHCVHVTQEDMQLLAKRHVSAAHCPVSNLKLASGCADVLGMVKAGMNVCLGTDSVASNNNLDLFEEIKAAALMAKGKTGDAIRSLMDLSPKTASVRRNGEIVEIPVEQVAVGDVVIVRSGSSIPVDGTVLEGRASVDQSALTGESVPVASLVEVADTVGVEYVSQFNLYRSVSLTVTPAARASTTTVMREITATAAETLPDDIGTAWSGTSYQEANASKTGGLVYALALVFVFLALAALYESWGLPLAILMSVPVAVLGAVLFVGGTHLMNSLYVNDIYMQISLVMLIGLAAKNAILVVEYADRLFREQGASLMDAAIGAAKLRVRPIIMTAFAFILGVMPLVFASGVYATARNIMGVALVGGMLFATLLGIFVYPALYYFVGKIGRFEQRRELKKQEENA